MPAAGRLFVAEVDKVEVIDDDVDVDIILDFV